MMSIVNAMTERQKKLYDFIFGYINKNGIAPSYREMIKHMNISEKGIYKMVSRRCVEWHIYVDMAIRINLLQINKSYLYIQ